MSSRKIVFISFLIIVLTLVFSRAPKQEYWSFALVSDVEVGNNYENLVTLDNAMLPVNFINEKIRKSNIQFVILLGDMVGSGYNESEWYKTKQWMFNLRDDVLFYLKIPYKIIYGNHDNIEHEYFYSNEVGGTFFECWRGHTGENINWVFDWNDVKFICLGQAFSPDEFTFEDIEFLKRELLYNGSVIIATHIPCFYSIGDTFSGLNNISEFYKRLNKTHNAEVIISGHWQENGLHKIENLQTKNYVNCGYKGFLNVTIVKIYKNKIVLDFDNLIDKNNEPILSATYKISRKIKRDNLHQPRIN